LCPDILERHCPRGQMDFMVKLGVKIITFFST
jgi:hypothetical protein